MLMSEGEAEILAWKCSTITPLHNAKLFNRHTLKALPSWWHIDDVGYDLEPSLTRVSVYIYCFSFSLNVYHNPYFKIDIALNILSSVNTNHDIGIVRNCYWSIYMSFCSTFYPRIMFSITRTINTNMVSLIDIMSVAEFSNY